MKMRLAVIFTVAFCLVTLPARADDAPDLDKLKADVIALDQAYADGDAATIESLQTPDFMSITARYVGPADAEQQNATKRKHLDHSPVEVVLLSPDIALVTFEKSYEGTYKGKPLPPRVAIGAIWIRQDGKWLNRTYQETQIAPE